MQNDLGKRRERIYVGVEGQDQDGIMSIHEIEIPTCNGNGRDDGIALAESFLNTS